MAASPGRAEIDGHDIRLDADVLVLGGGPAGAWAALKAAERGATVVLAEKGFVGTGGPTAAANTSIIDAEPQSHRRAAAVERRMGLACGLADRRWIERVLDEAHLRLVDLAESGYRFPTDEDGRPFRGYLRGPDYLRFMRRRLRKAGVRILDQSPALELLLSDGVVAGAAGIDRAAGWLWAVHAGAVVMATGGCAFLSKALGTNGATGDGYLMSAEAGATFSGMEITGQYGIAPVFTTMTKGILYYFATFMDEDGNVLVPSSDRQSAVAEHLRTGPVYAIIDRATPRIQEGLRRGQPNIFLSFDRAGIDPFTQRFPVTLRYEGTVRGVGGLAIADDCATTVPGLYAAGDAATRQNLVGAITGGGGPNSAWAIASGAWAGRAAAAFASRLGPRAQTREVVACGGAGLRPTERPAHLAIDELIAAVQQEMLPLDCNYFRHGARLAASRDRLEGVWRQIRSGLSATGRDLVRAREAAAMAATARLICASAIERRETRGISRRVDFPQADPAQRGRVSSGGLDQVWARGGIVAEEALAS